MSELLEEARERRDKAELSTEAPSFNWLDDSYYLGEQAAWREAVDLIEKHEKPKGLLQYVQPEWMNKRLCLTEKQQEIYETLMTKYGLSDLNFPDDDDNIFFAIEWACEENNYRDKDLIPALKKFLEEVEE